MATIYTCRGSVRGSCGVKHRTVKGANECMGRDQAWCRSQGGYSDRRLVVIEDGLEREPTEYEACDPAGTRWGRD